MMIDRRTFILGTELIAAAPAPVSTLPRRLVARPHSLLRLPADATAVDSPVFMIKGWSHPEDTKEGAGDVVWISVSQSWKTAWC